MELKQFPLSFSPWLSAFSYEAFEIIVIPSNFLIFVGQLCALFALCRIRWALWTTIFYDVTHIIIFVCSGIFFYKWILLNTSVVIALKTLKNKVITPVLAISLMMVIIAAPKLFFVAKLGWWDTSALNIERIHAITKDDKIIAVPTNFFGGFSVRMAQQRLIWDKSNGFFQTGTYGITLKKNVMEAANQHSLKILDVKDGDAIENYFSQQDNLIELFIKKHHRWALQSKGSKNNWFFDAYTHHIFSMPWEYEEFNNLDLDDIVAYRYSIESVYLGYENGVFTRSVIRENHHDIPIRH